MDDRTALVIGVTGISGGNLARYLLNTGWVVHGLSRTGGGIPDGVHSITADILDAAATRAELAGLPASHVFDSSQAIGDLVAVRCSFRK